MAINKIPREQVDKLLKKHGGRVELANLLMADLPNMKHSTLKRELRNVLKDNALDQTGSKPEK